MPWECADCGEKEHRNVKIPVCHHCGKPVCEKHREKLTDDAFSYGPAPTQSRVAVHCLDCKKEFHPRATNLEAGTVVPQGGANL